MSGRSSPAGGAGRLSRRRFLQSAAAVSVVTGRADARPGPNLILILTDDQRYDALGAAGNRLIHTPNLDKLAARGVRFTQACVTTSVCSASRAACLTGRYGSANGVPGLGGGLNPGETCFSSVLSSRGYYTGYVGKWHLKHLATPAAAGFEVETYFFANGPHYDRKVVERGKTKIAGGFLEDYLADQSIGFLQEAARRSRPFFLHLSTQLPHMDHEFKWNASARTRALYEGSPVRAPASWQDDLRGKPEYLKSCRNRLQALRYGYDRRSAIERHIREYYASVTELDRCLGRVLDATVELGLAETTYILLTGDNGWFLGEHGFTSKVLPYEESIRVPFLLAGPGIEPGVNHELVLNIDIAPTFLEAAGAPIPAGMHGRSLLPLVRGEQPGWRRSILYEALAPTLGSHPLVAVRTREWKYIQTLDMDERSEVVFEELYDLRGDPGEMANLAGKPEYRARRRELREELARLRASLAA